LAQWRRYCIERKLYFGQLPLTKIIGLRDELSGGITLPSGTHIETDWIYPEEVKQNWQIITSLEALAIEPLMMLSTRVRYPVEDAFRQSEFSTK
jgi:hypothetical protein